MSRSFADILREEMKRPGISEAPPAQDSATATATDPISLFGFRIARPLHVSTGPARSAYKRQEKTQHSSPPSAVETPVAVREPVARRMTPVQHAALQQFVRLGARNLSEYATDTEIKKAYRRLALRLHPDMNGCLSTQEQKRRTEQFHLLTQAYQILLDPA